MANIELAFLQEAAVESVNGAIGLGSLPNGIIVRCHWKSTAVVAVGGKRL